MDRRRLLKWFPFGLSLQRLAAAPQKRNERAEAEAPQNRPTREELVTARTEDDLVQSGLLVVPVGRPLHPTAVIWIHGAGQNFYFPSYVQIARATAALGYPFLTANTRMHDMGSLLAYRSDGNVRGGMYWGIPSKEPLDVAAWIKYAQTRGYPSVVLVGHSAGGPAVRRYVAEHRDERVIGLVLASVGLGVWPPKADPALLKAASELVVSGRSNDFLPNFRLGAATYLDYAHIPDDIRDFYGVEVPEPAITRVRCPILAWYGSKDVGTAADLERLRLLVGRHSSGPVRVDTVIIEGADHLYAGQEAQIAKTLTTWISKLPVLRQR